MRRQAILLNGPSSSGKSTLARALRRLLQEQGREFGIVSIDDLLEMSSEEPIYEDDVYAITSELGAWVRAVLDACGGVILDQVMTSERMDDGMLQALDGCSTLTVRARGAAPQGSAARRPLHRVCGGVGAVSVPKDGVRRHRGHRGSVAGRVRPPHFAGVGLREGRCGVCCPSD